MPTPDSTPEIWKPIPLQEFAGLYEISNLGRFRSTFRRGTPGKIRKPKPEKHGYLYAVLSKNNRQVKKLLHLLVAQAFLGPCPLGKEVNHKDCNKANSAANNLEYLTKPEHVAHMILNGQTTRGEKNCKAKLTEPQIKEIRNSAEIARVLAVRFGVHKSTIYRIKWKIGWRHVF